MEFFTKQITALQLKNLAYKKFTLDFLEQTLAADLGAGDLTTKLLGPKQKQKVTAEIRAKASGIIAGLPECEIFWQRHGIKVQLKKRDGEVVRRGEVVVRLVGTAKAILTTERTALNLLQRMSGIATEVHVLVKKFGKNKIAGTRKTPFGLLDCRAIVVGGGLPHRLNLADQILVKENHLAVDPECWKRIQINEPFEIEADNEKLALEIAKYFSLPPVKGGPRGVLAQNLILLLDNFTPAQLKKLVPKLRVVNPKIVLEASGGITSKNVGVYLKTGVDYVSLGSLTHSARVLDLSLKIVKVH